MSSGPIFKYFSAQVVKWIKKQKKGLNITNQYFRGDFKNLRGYKNTKKL